MAAQKRLLFFLLFVSISIHIFDCQYNYLCDWSTAWTQNNPSTYGPASWSFEPNGCSVSQTNQYVHGAVAWLGDDTNTLSWTDYTIETELRVTAAGGSGSWAGIIFRAQSIGNAWDGGRYYYSALVPNDYYQEAEFDNSYNNIGSDYNSDIDYNENLKLRIEVTGNSWDVYIANTLRYTGTYAGSGAYTAFTSGSVGIRTYSCAVTFNYFYITLPTSAPTTKIPSQLPITNIPTTSNPVTAEPTTTEPTSATPTTAQPTTAVPTSTEPTSAEPTTSEPTSIPTSTPTATEYPTSGQPSSLEPTIEPSKFTTIVISNPTIYPVSVEPTLNPTQDGIIKSTSTTEDIIETTGSTKKNNSNGQLIDNLPLTEEELFYIIVGIIIICLCSCVIQVYMVKYRKKKGNIDHDKDKTSEMVRVISTSHISKMESEIDINTTNIVAESTTIHNDDQFVQNLETNLVVQDMLMDDIIDDITTPIGPDDDDNDNNDKLTSNALLNDLGDMVVTPMGSDDPAIQQNRVMYTFNKTDDMIIDSDDDVQTKQ